ncbi:MAG: DmsC/YnfH family molybdoenzyme membrane anchor subunit [Bacillota bacterium]
MMQDWALVIFTLCISAAAGGSIFYALKRQQDAELSLERGFLYLIGLVGVGMLGSLLHLGRPLAAPYAIFNLGSSWLSREILFAVAFALLLVICWFLERQNKLNTSLIWLSSIVGLISVFSMTQIYMSTLIPAWQSWYTIVEFFVATAILGVVFAMLTLPGGYGGQQYKWVLLGAVLLQIALMPSFFGFLGVSTLAGQASISLLAGSFGILNIVRWLLVVSGVAWFVISPPKNSHSLPVALLLTVGVVLGRYIFYVTGVVITVGMLGM